MEKSTSHRAIVGGIPINIPNRFTNGKTKNYYISYNNVNIQDYGSTITAVVVHGKEQDFFLILNNNHEKELVNQPDLEHCVQYIVDHADQLNTMSDLVLADDNEQLVLRNYFFKDEVLVKNDTVHKKTEFYSFLTTLLKEETEVEKH